MNASNQVLTRHPLWRNPQLLAICVVVCATYTGIGAVGTVRVLYARSQGASLAIIGAMASAFLIANFAAQYPSGVLADRLGRRKMIIAGLLLQTVLTISYLWVRDPLLFVMLRLAEGCMAAMVLPPARALVADATEEQERGHAYGIFSAFFNAGFLLGPALGGLLAALSYNIVFVVAAGFRVLAVLLALSLLPAGHTAMRRDNTRRESWRLLTSRALIGAYILAFGDYLYFGFDQTLMPLWIRNNLGAPVAAIGMLAILWSLPLIVLSPLTGRLADHMRRSTLILVFGLAQVPFFLAYGLAQSVLLVVVLTPLHGCIYTLVQPAVDAHVAASSGSAMRARVQSMYSAVGLVGAFIGANAFTPLYSLNWHLPLPVEGVLYGMCVVTGGLMIRASEARLRGAGTVPPDLTA